MTTQPLLDKYGDGSKPMYERYGVPYGAPKSFVTEGKRSGPPPEQTSAGGPGYMGDSPSTTFSKDSA